MFIGIFLLIISALVIFLMFIPELLPRCSCCLKLKLRPFFKIHRAVSLNPGYKGSRSVCTKCCREYNISNLQDLDKVINIKKHVEIKSLL